MKLLNLTVRNYRSLQEETIEFGDLTVFIGANASGKSAILDALRFLSEAVQARDFRSPVSSRGGILNLAWKGREADQIELTVVLDYGDRRLEWSVRLNRQAYEFHAEEQIFDATPGELPTQLLRAEDGEGWWRSGEKGDEVRLKQPPLSARWRQRRRTPRSPHERSRSSSDDGDSLTPARFCYGGTGTSRSPATSIHMVETSERRCTHSANPLPMY